ncbi:MAG: RNB domain-containing ribonuclease [Thermodesulfobacteriota bacterium]
MNRNKGQHRDDLKVIARRAMIDHGLLPDFSPEIIAELSSIEKTVGKSNSGIRDLRGLLWASIDNDDSRDLDQISVAEPLSDGKVKIFVAVADVDDTVKKGSAIDSHSWHNTTSVYTAAEIFSMLPEKLSTDLTSLNEGADRLAIVVEMVINQEGMLISSDLYRATVHNHAKLAYNSVAAWLEKEGPMPETIAAVSGLDEQIRIQDRIAQRLRNVRHERGALSLETIEASPIFDGDRLTDLEVERSNRAKELIEDLMVAANGVTANYLAARGLPSIRRVLREPDRWQRICELVSDLGERLPPEPDAVALEKFLAKQKKADPLSFPDLSLSVIKLIGRGEYVADLPGATPPGHFGLAVRDYTHSTAPNRRFPDLVTQRLLKAAMAGQPVPYSDDELKEVANHCTIMENEAKKVERQVSKSAAALLLESRIGEKFDAVVTGASEKGTWVRILELPVEGKLVRGFDGLDVGDRVRVELIRTDVERGFIDFARRR